MAHDEGSTAAGISFDATHEAPIAQLDTTRQPPSQTHIRAVVALIYPFSSHTQTAAVLLADPDMRQRSRKGQVRVQLCGAAAVAFANSRIGSGDELLLKLEGARWVEEDKNAVHTPGRSVDAELYYDRRLVLQATREKSIHATLDIDAPAPPAHSQSPSSSERNSQSSSPPLAAIVTPALSRARSRMNFGHDVFKDLDLTPIAYDDENYDPFLTENDDRHPRKRTKLGRKSGEWKLVGWHDKRPQEPTSPRSLEKLPDTPLPQRQNQTLALDVVNLVVPAEGGDVIDLISPDQSAAFPTSFNPAELSYSQDIGNLGNSHTGSHDLTESVNHHDAANLAEPHHTTLEEPDSAPNLPNEADLSDGTVSGGDVFTKESLPVDGPAHSQPIPVSAVEPLFGPDIATEVVEMPELSHQPGRQSFLSAGKETSLIHDDSGSSSAMSEHANPAGADERISSFPSQGYTSDPLPAVEKDSTSSALLGPPESSTSWQQEPLVDPTHEPVNFVQPSAPASSSRPQMAISLPQSPLLQPMPSHSLPLISPFPSSPFGSSQLPASTSQSFQPSASTPPTSQSVPQSQEEYFTGSPNEKQISPLPALHLDTNAPAAATLPGIDINELDKVNKVASQSLKQQQPEAIVIDDSPNETVSDTLKEIDGMDTSRTLPKSVSNIGTYEITDVSDTSISGVQSRVAEVPQVPQLDGAGDAMRYKSETDSAVASKDAAGLAETANRPISETSTENILKDTSEGQNVAVNENQQEVSASNQEPATTTNTASRHEDEQGGANRNDQKDVEAVVTPNRHGRPSIIPDSLSPFFEVVPPRRSGRQTKPTEKVRVEQKGVKVTQRDSIASESPTEVRVGLQARAVVESTPIEATEAADKTKPSSAAPPHSSDDSLNQDTATVTELPPAESAHEPALSPYRPLKLGQDYSLGLVQSRAKGFRTPLSYFAALQNIDVYLNASSSDNHGSLFDVFAIVTRATSAVARAKVGPKHHYTVLHITDASPIRPEVLVECFRPRKDALPTADQGDVILLRAPMVKSRDGQLYLLSGSTSAWHVWRFSATSTVDLDRESNDEAVVEECRGPQVELGVEEQQHARALHKWWLSVKDDWLQERKSSKSSPNQRRGRVSSSKAQGKRNKGKQKRS